MKLIRDPNSIKVNDDIIVYMNDTLKWIPTIYPYNEEPFMGLYLHGPTIIYTEGAYIAQNIFRTWASLFENAPLKFELTGLHIGDGYETLHVDKNEIISALKKLEEYAAKVIEAKGELYILHFGI